MIESRGDDGIAVLANRGVLVEDIAQAIVMYKSVEWICNRYPVGIAEIFEVVDYIADQLEDTINYKSIKFKNHGTPDNIDLETRMITDGMFFNIVRYGKIMYDEIVEIDELYSKGLSAMIAEIYADLERGASDFEASAVHNAVYTGVRNELGDLPPDQVLANFDRINYISRKGI